MPTPEKIIDPLLAKEAKSIVTLAFRNGPIEDVHSGLACPTCTGKAEYSHITQQDMKQIMQQAVDTVYSLLWLREYEPRRYEEQIQFGSLYTQNWGDPQLAERKRERGRKSSLR